MTFGNTAPTAVQRWMVTGMREKLIDLLLDTVAECMPTECLADIADYIIANDVVQVVRCKECKNWEDGWLGYCTKGHFAIPYDGFCSYGERKDNERKTD